MAKPSISLLGATYSGVAGVTLPTSGGGAATFPWVEGSETKTENGTYDVTNLAQLVVNVSGGGGGASNICQGTFTTGSTGATTATFDTGYTGSGYPIAMFIYVDGGPYNNSSTYGGNTTWYNSKVRYDCGFYAMVKSRVPEAPDYSSVQNGTVAIIYKNSTSSSTTYTRTSTMTAGAYVSGTTNASASTGCARFKGDSKTVSYYVGNGTSDTIGFPKSTKMAYIVIYSS